MKRVGQFEWVSILPQGLSHKGGQHKAQSVILNTNCSDFAPDWRLSRIDWSSKVEYAVCEQLSLIKSLTRLG